MITLKLRIFSYIDEVIDYKHSLEFEIKEAKKAIDALFFAIFNDDERFINYTSRIKTDDSLKEKIIRQNYIKTYGSPTEIFDNMSDVIGARLECRFINDEGALYQALYNFFPKKREDGYCQSDRDPRIELLLDGNQPLPQKNGFSSYRIDGRFLGKRVLNFELQIKSIVNVFWNEIDHKILYKNYNYVVTEKFVREIMGSIRGDLIIIDRQMEMVYDHLRTLDDTDLIKPTGQIKSIVGRILQDVYIAPLRERDGLVFDFRQSIDLITDFLFAKVQYESRESVAEEFVRIVDEATKSNDRELEFGEMVIFDPEIRYYNQQTEILGRQMEEECNSDVVWNMIARIIFNLNPEADKRQIFRTFVDYIYFMIIQGIRDSFTECDKKVDDETIDFLAESTVQAYIKDMKPDQFTSKGIGKLKRYLKSIVGSSEEEMDIESIKEKYIYFLNH